MSCFRFCFCMFNLVRFLGSSLCGLGISSVGFIYAGFRLRFEGLESLLSCKSTFDLGRVRVQGSGCI